MGSLQRVEGEDDMRRLRLLSLVVIVAGLVLGMTAIALDSTRTEAAPEDDIAAMLQDVKAAWNAQDVDTFISYWTDEGLAYQFDFGDEDPADFIAQDMVDTGPMASISVTDLFVTGGNANGVVDLQFEGGFSLYEEWKFYFLDGGWKIGTGEPASRPIPPGVPSTDLALQEYSFNFNKAAVQAADGNIAFRATNVGQEEHEILVLRLDTNKDLGGIVEDIAQSESEDFPPGIDFVTFGGVLRPGQSTNVILTDLEPGRYGFICFLPSPDGTPHAFLGMINDFTVGGQGPVDGGGAISPPNTGDAGLLDGGTSGMTWSLLVVAVALVLGGATGLVVARARSGS
jgi:hypothetical protein